MASEDRSKITQIGGHSTSKQGNGLFPSAAHFLLLHLGAAWFYYSFKYDVQGTLKPSWTEMLG